MNIRDNAVYANKVYIDKYVISVLRFSITG